MNIWVFPVFAVFQCFSKYSSTYFDEHICTFLLSLYLGVDLLGHMYIFKHSSYRQIFFQIYVATSSIKVPVALRPCQYVSFSSFF